METRDGSNVHGGFKVDKMALNRFFLQTLRSSSRFSLYQCFIRILYKHIKHVKTNATRFDACTFARLSPAFGHRTAMCVKTDVSDETVERFSLRSNHSVFPCLAKTKMALIFRNTRHC